MRETNDLRRVQIVRRFSKFGAFQIPLERDNVFRDNQPPKEKTKP
jgi:hypothetical protein